MKNLLILAILNCLFLGCASDYPCGEPKAGVCSSISHNIEKVNDLAQDTDNQKYNFLKKFYYGTSNYHITPKHNTYKTNTDSYPQIPSSGNPLISTPSMLRIWLSPYVDNDNIYHEQSYQYMILDKGHWLYGSNNNSGKNYNLLLSYNIPSTNKQDNTDLISDNNTTTATTPVKPVSQNNNENTPALNFLKQQDQNAFKALGFNNDH
jgi:type IV conjugative transfer system lipoprotein TraV